MNIEESIDQLRQWDAAYATDNPVVDDATYDAFRDTTRRLAPDHPYFREVGAKPASTWPKAKHHFFMGSLNKVQTPDELKAWLPKQEAFVSLKLDGISIRLRYVEGSLVQAVTRGDGEVGEDITPNVKKMQGVVLEAGSFTGDVRGEIVLRKSVFEKSFKSEGYKNCRNAAGGAAKDLKGGKCHLLSIMCYQIRPEGVGVTSKDQEFSALRGHGFETAGHGWRLQNADEVLAFYQTYIAGERESLDFDIDGLVVEVNDTDAREAMGRPITGLLVRSRSSSRTRRRRRSYGTSSGRWELRAG